MTPLRLTRFDIWQVVVPVRADVLFGEPTERSPYTHGMDWPTLPIHLVEGRTKDGLVAIGECGRGETPEAVEATLHSLLNVDLAQTHPSMIWASEFQPGGMASPYRVPSWRMGLPRSCPLMESLWLDAVGKRAGLPADTFLGGTVRNRVAVDYWANRPDARRLVQHVKRADQLGLRGMKIKSDGLGDTVQALVEASRHVSTDFHFTVDPMCAWRSLRETGHLFDAIEKLPFRVQVEDPFAYGMPEDWRVARARYRVPIICHCRTEDVLRWALREQAADALNLGGGSTFDFIQLAATARFHGKDCWQGSALELGVLQRVRLHAAAAATNCVMPSDLQSEWVREHTLVTPRMQYEDGYACVPTEPGLGIALDHRALKKYLREHRVIG